MSILLRTPNDAPASGSWDFWFAVSGTVPPDTLDSRSRLPDLPARLETAFEAIRPIWWQLGRELGGDPSAAIAVAPTGSVGSDFGVMLAWGQLVQELGAIPDRILCLCSDPWLFRHLASLPGVSAGSPPALLPSQALFLVRGALARGAVAVRAFRAARQTRRDRDRHRPGSAALLVYGHPASTAATGLDAYFGDLMRRIPALIRVLHVDCPAERAREIAQDSRTASLHAWGTAGAALSLLWALWRPSSIHRNGRFGWLVRRAAARENGGGGPAMIRWQIHCQERWLKAVRPDRVAWPWENLSWERSLCRAARILGIMTIGYQHTVVGRHQINQSPSGNSDGLNSLPDLVLCNGKAYRDELAAWGVPPSRLKIAGAFRFAPGDVDRFKADGPILVALSSLAHANSRLLRVARSLAETGFPVLVKEHPMYPMADIEEGTNLRRTETGIGQHAGLRAVVFATGTMGLDALRARVPAYRLRLEDGIAWDVAPEGVNIAPVTADTAVAAVSRAEKAPAWDWSAVFAPVDEAVWRETLAVSRSPAGGP